MVSTVRASLLATAVGAVSGEILVQSVWNRADLTSPANCRGSPTFNVVYGVNECATVQSEDGLVQRALQPYNTTHLAVFEYYPESNCDTATTAFVLEIIRANNECAVQDFGMPDSGLPDEALNTTTTTAAVISTTAITGTPSGSDVPPLRRRQAASGSNVATTATATATATSTVTTTEAVTGTSTPMPPVAYIPASYKAVITNGTLTKETDRSLLINTFTTVGNVARKDWCGDTNATGLVKATYNVPIGSCFTIPAQTPQEVPHYGVAYVGSVGTANSVFVRWYNDASCRVARTLYFDAIGLSQCMNIEEDSATTLSFGIKNSPVPVPSTTSLVKASTTTQTIPAPTPSNFQSAATTASLPAVGAIVSGLLTAVAFLL